MATSYPIKVLFCITSLGSITASSFVPSYFNITKIILEVNGQNHVFLKQKTVEKRRGFKRKIKARNKRRGLRTMGRILRPRSQEAHQPFEKGHNYNHKKRWEESRIIWGNRKGPQHWCAKDGILWPQVWGAPLWKGDAWIVSRSPWKGNKKGPLFGRGFLSKKRVPSWQNPTFGM